MILPFLDSLLLRGMVRYPFGHQDSWILLKPFSPETRSDSASPKTDISIRSRDSIDRRETATQRRVIPPRYASMIQEPFTHASPARRLRSTDVSFS